MASMTGSVFWRSSLLFPSRVNLGGIRQSGCSLSFVPRCQLDIKVRVENSLYKRELEAAVDVVERACRLCLSVQTSMNTIEDVSAPGIRMEKNDATPVTVADFGVQALVSLELGLLFPSIALVGEEDATQLRQELSSPPNHPRNVHRQALVEAVTEAVASVASKQVQDVTTERVLDAIDRGKNVIESNSYWILDPIDGTRGFLRGGDALYVVGLALVVQGKAVLGVMGCPNLKFKFNEDTSQGTRQLQMASFPKRSKRAGIPDPVQYQAGLLMAACTGCGCWVKPLSTSPVQYADEDAKEHALEDMVESKVDACESFRKALFCISDHDVWRSVPIALALASTPFYEDRLPEHDAKVLPLCCGSLCKYFAVALGGASLFVQHVRQGSSVKVWDHAAGVICVVEAGGQVTDMRGNPLQKMIGDGKPKIKPQGGGIIASNGSLQERVLRSLPPT